MLRIYWAIGALVLAFEVAGRALVLTLIVFQRLREEVTCRKSEELQNLFVGGEAGINFISGLETSHLTISHNKNRGLFQERNDL